MIESVKRALSPEPAPQQTLPAVDLDTDTLTEIVSNSRRRLVVAILAAENGIVSTSELSDRVCMLQTGSIRHKERKAVYVGLYQCHLPTLVEEGIIEKVGTHEYRGTATTDAVDDAMHIIIEMTQDGECA